jgi:hypothetical protein
VLSGKTERLPYSLSRWTDLPAAKWPWFERQLKQGWMLAFDPRTAVPDKWSLEPKDSLGLIFWTRNPLNLIKNAHIFKPYSLVVHMTITGWVEVEKGAPDIDQGLELMTQAVKAFGARNVTWRFSPVPAVEDTLERFERIAKGVAPLGLQEVYVAFLQDNDLMPETRGKQDRRQLLQEMTNWSHGLKISVCNEDLEGTKVCESGQRFGLDPTLDLLEDCGCCLAVDPFTITEACCYGCAYCYAADKSLAPQKRDTTC